jgi:cytochrome c biogenesis protein CcdA
MAAALVSVFTVALLHTLIPSHWLCFVVVARAHGWSTRKTLAVTALAGLLHVATTILLGVAGASVVHVVLREEETLERASSLLLIALGVLYLALHLFHAGHHHQADQHRGAERTALATLLLSLVVSPCTAAIPILMATAGGADMMILIGAVLLVTTVGGMISMVALTSLGVEKLRFAFFDRFEKLIVGFVLIALGALVLLVHP